MKPGLAAAVRGVREPSTRYTGEKRQHEAGCILF